MRHTPRVLALAAVLLSGTALAAPAAGDPAPGTLANLQAAFQGESNAAARYLAFAKKADAEGNAQAARLFRAAARSEQIHAQNHAAVIEALGATPTADVKPPEVKSTRDNLQAAIAGETHEVSTMYPTFLEQARKEGNTAAVRTFNLARNAEVEHARLYRAALDGLEGQRQAQGPLHVCSVCGFTTAALPDRCPSSASPREKFERVD